MKTRKDLTLSYWQDVTDNLLEDHGVPVLRSAGSVSQQKMKDAIEARYEIFEARRKKEEAAAADAEDLAELEAEAKEISKKIKSPKS